MQCGRYLQMFQRNLLSSPFTLKMEAADFSETLLCLYQTPRRHIQEDGNIHSWCNENNKSHSLKADKEFLLCSCCNVDGLVWFKTRSYVYVSVQPSCVIFLHFMTMNWRFTVRPTSVYEDIWIYYIINIVYSYRLRSPIVAVFMEMFLRRMYYKDNQPTVQT